MKRFFFFSGRRRHTRCGRDWSSDVCSSDLGPAISRLGGALLLIVGGYVAYYGWYEIRLLHGGPPNDPIIDAATTIQRWLAGGLDHLGAPLITAVFALLLAAALLLARARHRHARQASEPN